MKFSNNYGNLVGNGFDYSSVSDSQIPSRTIDATNKPMLIDGNFDTENVAYQSYCTCAGSYTGAGGAMTLTFPFEPTFFIVKGDTSAANTAARIFMSTMWLQRPTVGDPIGNLGDVDIYGQTVSLTSGPLTSAGVTYHYIAISDPYGTTIKHANYQGNWLNTDYELMKGNNVQLALCKRDNYVPMHWAASDGTFGCMLTSALSGTMQILPDGTFRVNNDNTVNGGESNDVIQFVKSPFVNVFKYIGGWLTSMPTAVSDVEGILFIPQNSSAYGYPAHIWFPTDPTFIYPINTGSKTSALGISVARGRVNISTSQWFNKVNESYIAVVFEKNRNTTFLGSQTTRSKFTTPSSLILNAGVWIDCGNDDSLNISNDMTLEWYGQSLIATGSVGNGNFDTNGRCLFSRTSGTYGDPNTANFGLWLMYAPYISETPSFWIAPKNKVNFPTSAVWTEDVWQTGVKPNERQYQHFVARCDTSGNYLLYLNGKLVKERKHADITVPVSGLKMVIGGNFGTTSAADMANNIIAFSTIRVYDRALNTYEIMNNFKACGNSKFTATPDFVEEWKADNFNGTTLFATRNPANNGTIKGGTAFKLFKAL